MRTVWSRRRRWAVLVATTVVLTAGVWFFWGRPPTLRLPDGRVVTVRAVTWGTKHVYVEGSILARLAWRFRSPVDAYRLGYIRLERSTVLPMCMVWTSWSLPPGSNIVRFVSVADVNGIETEPVGVAEEQRTRPGQAVAVWPLENFPRSHQHMKLRFHVRDVNYHPECVGELLIRPPRVPRPAAHPAPPVLTVVQDGVEFSLLNAESRVPRLWEAHLRSFFVSPWNRVELSVREKDPLALSPSKGWTLHELQATGTSGNRAIERGSLAVQRGEDKITAWFAGALWPEEAGWTFNAEFERIADFAPGELFPLPPVLVPGGQLPVQTNLEVEAHDVLVKSIQISGPTRMRPFQRGGYRPNAEVHLVLKPRLEHLSVSLARVLDDQGRPVPFGHELPLGKAEYEAGLELPPEVRSLQFELAVRRRCLVQFTTGPGFVRPHPSAIAPRREDGQTPTP